MQVATTTARQQPDAAERWSAETVSTSTPAHRRGRNPTIQLTFRYKERQRNINISDTSGASKRQTCLSSDASRGRKRQSFGHQQRHLKHSTSRDGTSRELCSESLIEAKMKSSTLKAILVLQAVLVMGILAEVNAVGYWPKCCDNCRSFSGAQVCDDPMAKCHPSCVNCRVVQEKPVKTYRCADGIADDGTCGRKPCKRH